MRSVLFLLCCVLTSPLWADYSNHPKADELIRELLSSGLYQREEVLGILRDAVRRPQLVENEQKAPEKTKTWPEYQRIFLQADRISKGVAFMRTHETSLRRMQARYGVPASLVTAIIGVETRYGGYTGPHRVLDSLATQGFDHPSRSPFFFNELREFLLLCKERGLDPRTLKGSYAGAMGLSQFMPSNYRRLAVDFDADGVVDLWNPVDAIGSTGNYLTHYLGRQRDWQRGKPVAWPIELPTAEGLTLNSKQPEYLWHQIQPQVKAPQPVLAANQAVGLVSLDLGSGAEYWLALPNFYSIMSYNPRVYYAMAVYQLSLAIADAAADS